MKFTLKFLNKLGTNNNRIWFQENKPIYEKSHEEMVDFADKLLAEMNGHDIIETSSGKKSLYRIYRDVRFAKDKIWCFFALNIAQRRQNQKQGGYFVNGFFENGPKTLDEVKQGIENGNLNWINRITYFGSRIKGSASYWRERRSALYTWINHHIQKGHGAPSYFITFSCAEYHWPDVN